MIWLGVSFSFLFDDSFLVVLVLLLYFMGGVSCTCVRFLEFDAS